MERSAPASASGLSRPLGCLQKWRWQPDPQILDSSEPTTDFLSLLKECVGAVSLSGLMFKPLTNTKTCVLFLKKRSEEIQDIGSTTLR
jgi:hypothetical protein